MDDPFRRPALTPSVFYRDPWAALDFLEQAFGFERSMVITDQDGRLAHCELRFGDSLIYLGSEWTDYIASPASIDGKNTQSVHVHSRTGSRRIAPAPGRPARRSCKNRPINSTATAPIGRAIQRAMSGLSTRLSGWSRAKTPNGRAD
jgi:hypothetical protein